MGYGNNQFGQLGIGTAYNFDNGYDNIEESTPQKIAENVKHVDSGMYFTIFLTEDGKLYGMGANLNGVMGMEVPKEFDYYSNPEITVAATPILLMENVAYARSGDRDIISLTEDGSVWWWGEFRTTYSATGNSTQSVGYARPEKILEDAVYVTTGLFTAGAIKKDGTLWTWGNNTFGSCGIDTGGVDFVDEPVKVADDVKMVWFDRINFKSRIGFEEDNKYDYTYTTFIEKKDNSTEACGLKVEGEESKKRSCRLAGDILMSEDEISDEVTYSPVFVPITILEGTRQM